MQRYGQFEFLSRRKSGHAYDLLNDMNLCETKCVILSP